MAVDPPIGSILAWAGPPAKIPSNYKLCDGASLDRTVAANQALFDAIGTGWGGDGANMFNLPDLRGVFLRGVTGATGRDPDAANRTPASPGTNNPGNHGNAVGSVQEDAIPRHSHLVRSSIGNQFGDDNYDVAGGKFRQPPANASMATTEFGSGTETRPKNTYVHWIIRAQ